MQSPELPSPVLTHMWWSWFLCELKGCPCRSQFLLGSWWHLRWWLSGSLAQETARIRWRATNCLRALSRKTNHILTIMSLRSGTYNVLFKKTHRCIFWHCVYKTSQRSFLPFCIKRQFDTVRQVDDCLLALLTMFLSCQHDTFRCLVTAAVKTTHTLNVYLTRVWWNKMGWAQKSAQIVQWMLSLKETIAFQYYV